MIKVTLNHGAYVTREATTVPEATAVLEEWQPHLAVLDMDLGGDVLMRRMTPAVVGGPTRAPVLAVTRRGDLKTKLGEIEIDIMHRQVRAGSSEVHLTGLKQSLLYLLAANAGRVVRRGEILDALWGVDYVSESNVVDRHVRNLRAKLQNDWRKPRFIATVPGKGYRFIPTFSDPGSSMVG